MRAWTKPKSNITELLQEVQVLAAKRDRTVDPANRRTGEPASPRNRKVNPQTNGQGTPSGPPGPDQVAVLARFAGTLDGTSSRKFLQLSVASVRRWRLLRTGPKYLKIGTAVRYRREDVEWLNSCVAGLD